MDRHRLDVASLTMGLALLAVGLTVLVADLSGSDLDMRWVLPGVLLLFGATGLAGSLRRLPRRTKRDPAGE